MKTFRRKSKNLGISRDEDDFELPDSVPFVLKKTN